MRLRVVGHVLVGGGGVGVGHLAGGGLGEGGRHGDLCVVVDVAEVVEGGTVERASLLDEFGAVRRVLVRVGYTVVLQGLPRVETAGLGAYMYLLLVWVDKMLLLVEVDYMLLLVEVDNVLLLLDNVDCTRLLLMMNDVAGLLVDMAVHMVPGGGGLAEAPLVLPIGYVLCPGGLLVGLVGRVHDPRRVGPPGGRVVVSGPVVVGVEVPGTVVLVEGWRRQLSRQMFLVSMPGRRQLQRVEAAVIAVAHVEVHTRHGSLVAEVLESG